MWINITHQLYSIKVTSEAYDNGKKSSMINKFNSVFIIDVKKVHISWFINLVISKIAMTSCNCQ
jgi:hypothetical protein